MSIFRQCPQQFPFSCCCSGAVIMCAPPPFHVLLMTYADQILNRNLYFIVSSTAVAGEKRCAESGLQLRYRFFCFCWVRSHCPFSTPLACFGAYTVGTIRAAQTHSGVVREEPRLLLVTLSDMTPSSLVQRSLFE
jgi:hypothetical protein